MARNKKKRNKKYSGVDAVDIRPRIIKVQASNRNKVSQWLYERRKLLKITAIGVVIIAVIALLISGIVSLF